LNDGQRAEDIACRWLQARGLRLIARNHRCRSGEIDLVMQDGSALVVVEVRYRRNDAFGRPEETVDLRKQRRIVTATRHFLARNEHLDYSAVRFDVVGISAQLRRPVVNWIPDAFEPG
jgi:putative endonuclease